MKKLTAVSLLVAAFMIAAAFRFIGKPLETETKKGRQRVEFMKRLPSSCLVPPPVETYSYDIPPLTGWGKYKWKIDTKSDSAQFYFNQGINMYYAFHTIESRASFLKAIQFDSACAMIWYGMALSLGPTINYGAGYRATPGAFEAAVKSKQFAASSTPVEKGLIDAILVRYSADTSADLTLLQDHYTAAMKALAVRFPTNAEVVTLYADALMLEHPWDLYDKNMNPKAWTPLIDLTLEKALKISPAHPGANHYMIHTREGSRHPEKALVNAETLVGLMPDVAHITHMPSHIFIRTGHYNKGIHVNVDAVRGYDTYLNLYEPVQADATLYQFHAIHMNMTCAMMAGNYAGALHESNKIRELITPEWLNVPPPYGGFYQYFYSSLLFTQIRFGHWEEILTLSVPDSIVYASLLLHFGKGMAYSHLKNFTNASNELELLRKGMELKSLKEPVGPFSSLYDALLVAEKILTGTLAEQKHDYPAAIDAYLKAVSAEDNIIYNEPRDWLLPARQYLGNVYLETRAYQKAAEIFNQDLVVNPKNGWSLTGLKIVYQKTGRNSKLKVVSAEMKTAWQIRDVPIDRPVF